jgi:type IV pilus assembly protein PilX
MHKTCPSRLHAQRGASLAVALVVITVLMLSGVAAFYASGTQFRLAGNLQYLNAALNQTETAVAAAESWLATSTNFQSAGFTTYSSSVTPQLYPAGYLTTNNIDPLTMTWTDSNSKKVDTAGNQRYLIEMLATNKRLQGSDLSIGGRTSTGCSMVNLYRVTARGVSARGAAKTLQSAYSVKSC